MSRLQKYRDRIKYPFYLFLLLLFVKIAYVIVESYYNYYVLSITTSPSLTKETIESLNINGHRISAIGITLLLFPLLYYIAKFISQKYKHFITIIFSILVYFIAFNSLNMIIDKIVVENKEKRHDAYYVNVFKYGVLNNIFVYDSFVDSQRIQGKMMNINDRMLLINTFLLLHADERLVSKLKERGQEKVADVYIEQNLKEDFIAKEKEFYKASGDVCFLWNEINKNKIKVKDGLSQLEKKEMKKLYKVFTKGLSDAYFQYKNSWQIINDKIALETQENKINEIQKKLNKYFKYQKMSKARTKYRDAMIENFGYYLKAEEWMPRKNKVSKERIRYIIKREILRKVDSRLKKLPSNLNVQEFMYHYETKYNVMMKLKENNILVPFEFDYSQKEFEQYFEIMSHKKHIEAYDLFYSKLEEKIGKNDIKLSMDWSEFMHSDYIEKQIVANLGIEDEESIKNIILALESRDLANFREMVYLPKISEQIEKMKFDKVDFLDGAKASAYGDDAIKLLYVPPFALAISMISLLLNLITVFGMFLAFTNIPKAVSETLKILFVTLMVAVPIYYKAEIVNNNLLQQKSIEAKIYVNFLAWISYYEKQNSLLHEKKILPDVVKFL